jgi:hypothetical protein
MGGFKVYGGFKVAVIYKFDTILYEVLEYPFWILISLWESWNQPLLDTEGHCVLGK